MNKAKALLDSLMGPSRDVSNKNKANDEFLDGKCCKHYLIGCCPHAILGKKLEAIRQNPSDFCIVPGVMFDRASLLNPEGCAKTHSVALRDQFKQHPQKEKYRKDYEKDLRKLLARVVEEAESKTVHEKKKREAMDRNEPGEMMCDVCGMRYKLRKRDGIELRDDHPDSEIHQCYVKLRAKLDELNEKAAQQTAEDAKRTEEPAHEPKNVDDKVDSVRNRSRSEKGRATKKTSDDKDDHTRFRSRSRRGRDSERGQRDNFDRKRSDRGEDRRGLSQSRRRSRSERRTFDQDSRDGLQKRSRGSGRGSNRDFDRPYDYDDCDWDRGRDRGRDRRARR